MASLYRHRLGRFSSGPDPAGVPGPQTQTRCAAVKLAHTRDGSAPIHCRKRADPDLSVGNAGLCLACGKGDARGFVGFAPRPKS